MRSHNFAVTELEGGFAMAWILVGSVLLVLLIAGLAIDLKDRKRGGNRLARGRALGGSRRDDINQNPSLGSQNSSYIAS